ncbi:MAG: UDP-N-acetylglucosamine 2-epimerase (non-hydrolyzing) [Fluviicola sp.]|nr:MAG: UDP-N-acetylglucosamine 2-epimerase (non-hydrolyzing) [Fluviicola sp.]
MKKIVTIIGARPQIIKSAAISRAVEKEFPKKLEEIVVHTGQHYDENMSKVFFDELGIPKPQYNLGVGSGSHGKQTAEMLIGIEVVLEKENPDALVVYGDTNSTLAGATAAAKMNIPVVHIEAGLRSYNKSMPEEVNRVVCDHLSTLLFSPTKSGFLNLKKEGFSENNEPPYTPDNAKVYHCGDIMFDNSLYFSALASNKNTVIEEYGLENTPFFLSTIHRGSNTDNAGHLNEIFEAFLEVMQEHKDKMLVLPLHPRTKNCMDQHLSKDTLSRIEANDRIKIIPPVSFLNIIALEKNCEMVITDSGGLQKEAFFFKKPCVILRPETEWVEIVDNGNAIITNYHKNKIIDAIAHFSSNTSLSYPDFYGNGKAAEFICSEIISNL